MKPDWRTCTREQRVEIITNLLATKPYSASQVAAEFENCTRNMIIGLAHRAKIRFVNKPGGPKGGASQRARKEAMAERKAEARMAKPSPKPKPEKRAKVILKHGGMPVPVPVPAPESQRIALTDIPLKGRCRWPLWTEPNGHSSVFEYCGAPVAEAQKAKAKAGAPTKDHVYCAFHHDQGVKHEAA